MYENENEDDEADDEGGQNDSRHDLDPAADLEAKGMAEKLEYVFNLHTAQRMQTPRPVLQGSRSTAPRNDRTPVVRPTKAVKGVSIPSQRRFVGYWARVLSKQDPRPLDLLALANPSGSKRIRRQMLIKEIRVYMPNRMPGLPAILSKKQISIHLSRYKASFVDGLEERDLDLREMGKLEKNSRKLGASKTGDPEKLERLRASFIGWKDQDWDDKTSMFEKQGSLIEQPSAYHIPGHTEAAGVVPFRVLYPGSVDGQLVVDADRELQLKLLIGDTGHKHSMLPDVVILSDNRVAKQSY